MIRSAYQLLMEDYGREQEASKIQIKHNKPNYDKKYDTL